MRLIVKQRRQLVLLLIITLTAYSGYGFACDRAPKTVAAALTTLGNVKREAKKAGELTAQQDLDISRKLHEVNRAYKQFVVDEQARIAAGTVDPATRSAQLVQIRSLISGLSDPSLLGFKSDGAKKTWAASITTLNTVLAAFGG